MILFKMFFFVQIYSLLLVYYLHMLHSDAGKIRESWEQWVILRLLYYLHYLMLLLFVLINMGAR